MTKIMAQQRKSQIATGREDAVIAGGDAETLETVMPNSLVVSKRSVGKYFLLFFFVIK